MTSHVLPVIHGNWEAAELPWPLLRRLAELELNGEDIEGYGCPGMSPRARGLVNMELHRGDGSVATFLGVQSGRAMKSVAMHGSEVQRERRLPDMARLETAGSRASWSKATRGIRGHDHGGQGRFARHLAGRRLATRRSRWGGQAAAGRRDLPKAGKLLVSTRSSCAWSALGQAVAAYDIALTYAEARDLLGGNGVLLENHVIRDMGDMEVIHTYENTEAIQTLIVGRDITGVAAFA